MTDLVPETILFGSLAGHDPHVNWPGHPERPGRLEAVGTGLRDAGLEPLLRPLEGRPASRAELSRVHDPAYLDRLAAMAGAGGGELDPDTAMSAGSWENAVQAAGLGLAAVDALEAGAGAAAFVAVRPPGHHAGTQRAMGFCLLNNVAIAAAALAGRGRRVLIVDWDVHHGNGTQDIFFADPRILYVSTHQWPAYPGTGLASDVGHGDGTGLTLNVPLPAGATGDVVELAFDRLVEPAVEAFQPEWILISAGFDAHRADPLANLCWSAGDFYRLARRVGRMAPRPGRVVALLEGGYDLAAVGRSAAATVAGLAGVEHDSELPTAGGPGSAAVRAAEELRRRALESTV